MTRRLPRSTLFPTRRSSDLVDAEGTMETLYHLKPNTTWHDGRPLTADDFVFAHEVFSEPGGIRLDRKSTRVNSSHVAISYAVFCLKKKNKHVKTILYDYYRF